MSAVCAKYDSALHCADVVTRLVEFLYQEANDEDPVDEGYVSVANLNFVFRKEISPRPSQSLIGECMAFLSSSFVRAVVRHGDKYKLVDCPSNVARRLRGLSRGVGVLSAGE